jgi:hypothetical protein
MATRKKTIRIPTNFGNRADIATSTNSITGTVTLGTPLIPIMENSATNPVTFTSVNLYVGAQDTSTATGGSMTGFTATTQITGAATAQTVNSVTTTFANTGENWSGVFGPIDFTTHFNGSFGTETGKTVTVKFGGGISTGTGTAFRGVYGILEVTYTYDDTATGRTQTICIPYDSGTSTLTTTANTTFAVIPNLTGAGGWFSGHTNPVIRHRWIELKGNCNNNNTTTNHGMIYAFDGGTGILLPQRISGLGSDTYQIYLVDAFSGGSVNTAAQHNFQLWNSLATRWANLTVSEWITYDYAVSGTTEAWNYIEMGAAFSPPAPSATTVADRYSKTFIVQEPTPILYNSAFDMTYTSTASATVQFKAGIQSAYRAYAQTSNVCAGAFGFQHRIDSGATGGVAFALNRGENTVYADLYKSAGLATMITGTLKILYKSGVSSLGVDAHNHTTTSSIRNFNTTLFTENTVNDSVTFPETNYYINGIGMQHHLFMPGTAALPVVANAQARILSGESTLGGWKYMNIDYYSSDGEISYVPWTIIAGDDFKRYPRDADLTRMDLSSTRAFRTTFTTASMYGYKWITTYHSIYTAVTGTISGSAGGIVDVDLFVLANDGISHTMYDSTVVTGNSVFSFTVYDNTKTYMVTAHESNSLKGVSIQSVPGGDFSINLAGSSSGTSVTTGYAGG